MARDWREKAPMTASPNTLSIGQAGKSELLTLTSYMIERQNRAGNWERVFGPTRAASEVAAIEYFTTKAYPSGLPATLKTLRAVKF